MWTNTLIALPLNGSRVWLRKEWFSFFAPIAVYDSDTFIFTLEKTGLIISASEVARWKLYTGSELSPIGVAKVGSTLIVG